MCFYRVTVDPINDPIKLYEREKQIVELLREEADLTRKEMAERLETIMVRAEAI